MLTLVPTRSETRFRSEVKVIIHYILDFFNITFPAASLTSTITRVRDKRNLRHAPVFENECTGALFLFKTGI